VQTRSRGKLPDETTEKNHGKTARRGGGKEDSAASNKKGEDLLRFVSGGGGERRGEKSDGARGEANPGGEVQEEET